MLETLLHARPARNLKSDVGFMLGVVRHFAVCAKLFDSNHIDLDTLQKAGRSTACLPALAER